MCLMTYMLYLSLDLSMCFVLAYAWCFNIFFSIHFNLIIMLLHSKAQHVQYGRTKNAHGVMVHPDWIGEQGYYVNTLR
jgi:hypothetical protein